MRIVSGIQPTGNLHLGNYLGAIVRWVAMQDNLAATGGDCLFFLADLHAITVRNDPAELRANTRNMAAALIKHEQITTTTAKAKELRPYVEKLITLAKHGGLSNRRLAQSRLMDDAQLVKLFDVLAKRYADRNGGYTRIIKAGIRASDAAPISIIEFVDQVVSAKGQDSGPVVTEEEFEAA